MDAVAAAHRREPGLVRLLAATSVGNALEWFDVAVYGYFAIYISGAFFPAQSGTVSLVLTFSSFAISYLARPLGAVFLGAYADRVGRKASMLLSINMMVVGTALVAFMPTYASIGVLAPIGIVLARLVQGFSAGGEFGSSTALLVERDPARRGFVASWQFASQGLSTLTASLFGLGLTSLMDPVALKEWGWRIPFVFGLLVGPVGYYIRRHIPEPVAEAVDAGRRPLATLFGSYKAAFVLAMGCLVLSTAVQHVIVYVPTYAVREFGIDQRSAFLATTGAGILLTVLTPFAGLASDRFGRVRVMLWAGVAMLLTFLPAFLFLDSRPGAGIMIAVVLWLAVMKALYFGPLPALMADLFPGRVRATGLALSYNVGVTAFGGFGPVVMLWIKDRFGTSIAPAWYLTFVAVLSLVALVATRRVPHHRG